MCCFSGPVASVSATKIFGRVEGRRQFLAYQMTFSAATELAMVLPIPVVPGTAEDAVSFLNLEHYHDFFNDLERLFPVPRSRSAAPVPTAAPLTVHDVGIYSASFVPSIADFDRLDPRFRLADHIWESLPSYAQHGFAVFKLKPGQPQRVHPLALSFPTATPDTIFFPTLHIHDAQVHRHAHFDHILYAQSAPPVQPARRLAGMPSTLRGTPRGWLVSPATAGTSIDIERAQGIVSSDRPLLKKVLIGQLPNQDHAL